MKKFLNLFSIILILTAVLFVSCSTSPSEPSEPGTPDDSNYSNDFYDIDYKLIADIMSITNHVVNDYASYGINAPKKDANFSDKEEYNVSSVDKDQDTKSTEDVNINKSVKWNIRDATKLNCFAVHLVDKNFGNSGLTGTTKEVTNYYQNGVAVKVKDYDVSRSDNFDQKKRETGELTLVYAAAKNQPTVTYNGTYVLKFDFTFTADSANVIQSVEGWMSLDKTKVKLTKPILEKIMSLIDNGGSGSGDSSSGSGGSSDN